VGPDLYPRLRPLSVYGNLTGHHGPTPRRVDIGWSGSLGAMVYLLTLRFCPIYFIGGTQKVGKIKHRCPSPDALAAEMAYHSAPFEGQGLAAGRSPHRIRHGCQPPLYSCLPRGASLAATAVYQPRCLRRRSSTGSPESGSDPGLCSYCLPGTAEA
jgi:hypothetical protein